MKEDSSRVQPVLLPTKGGIKSFGSTIFYSDTSHGIKEEKGR